MNYYFIQINQGYGLLFSRQIVVLPATGAWIYGGSVLAPEVKHSVSLNPLTFTGGPLYIWKSTLVAGLEHFLFSKKLVGMMIQSAELIFFRGVGIPPASTGFEIFCKRDLKASWPSLEDLRIWLSYSATLH